MPETIMPNHLIIPVEQPMPPARKKIGIVIPCLNYFMGVVDLLLSIKTRHEYRIYIQPQYIGQVPLAQAWNHGCDQAWEDGCDYALVCNDDILFSKTMIDDLVGEYERLRPEGVIMVTPNNIFGQLGQAKYAIIDYEIPADQVTTVSEHPNFSCFLVTKEYFDLVGRFDENFIPAWAEDQDSHQRATLLGLREVCTTGAVCNHLGSVTTKLMDNPNSTQSVDYFLKKWSSHNDSPPQTFNTPYGNPALTPKDWVHDYAGKLNRGEINGLGDKINV